MSQEAKQALTVLLPAMATAAASLSIAWRPWRRASRIEHGYWGGALALGLGFIAGFYFVAGARGFQLQDGWHWLWLIAGAAMALGAVAATVRANLLMRVLSGLALAGAVALLFHPPGRAATPMLWKIGLGASALVLWMFAEPIAQRRRGAVMPIAMVIVFAGVSIVMLQTRQAGYSLLAAALSAMCGIGLVIALLNPRLSLAHGAMHVIGAMLASLCVTGWLYNFTEVPVWPFAMLLASPLAMWVGEWRPIARLRPWQRVGVSVFVTAIVVTTAVAWPAVAKSEAGDLGY